MKALAIVLAFALLVLPSAGKGAAGPAGPPVEVDAILTLTGGNAFIGQGARQSFQAVEEQVNSHGGIRGRPLRFVYHDDQTIPELSVQIATAIVAKKAPVFVGPAYVAGCRAELPLVKAGPVMYCISPGLYPDPGSYAFSANVSTASAAAAAMKFFVSSGLRRIAIITAIDANGQDADRAIEGGLDAINARDDIVAHEHFNPTDLSVSAQMARIRAANPQLIIAWSSGTPLGTLLRGIKEAGLDDVAVMTTNANANRATLHQYTSLLPKNLYFALSPSELPPDQISDPATRRAVTTYLAAMKAVGVAQPDESNDCCWDMGTMVADAYRALGPGATATQIRDYIDGLHGWIGIRGAYDFKKYPQRGLSEGAVVVARWDPARDAWLAASRPGGLPLK